MMGVSDIEKLRGLVDSSLHSPDYGVVNFHQLHKVLHGILSHLGLQFDGNVVAVATDKAKDTLARNSVEKEQDIDDLKSGESNENVSNLEQGKESISHDGQERTTGPNVEDQEVER